LDPQFDLPPGLPVPVDDGAAKHLQDLSIPRLALPSTHGRNVSIRDESFRHPTVVFAYPRTGIPGRPAPAEWDAIPGARGCTPQTCAFRDLAAGFQHLGARVFGLSVQTTDYQQEMAKRLHVPFEILSDDDLRLQKAARLPTFTFGGEKLLKRVTFVARRGRIIKVFYPVFPPDQNASDVLEWLGAQTAHG
jgi:peroxiredoxin